MNIATTLVIQSTSSGKTEQLAEQIGQNLKGGEVIELISDLGGGKTTFVRGLAKGAGSNDHVSSPTYTISKVYKTAQLDIYHFDFYRLDGAGIIEHELSDILSNPKNVLVVEWGEIIRNLLPSKRLTIKINTISVHEREITIKYHPNLHYLFQSSPFEHKK